MKIRPIDSYEVIRENAEKVFAVPEYVHELKPYQKAELARYVKDEKRALAEKFGIEDGENMTALDFLMYSEPEPTLEGREKLYWINRIESALSGEVPTLGGPQIRINPKEHEIDFLRIIDALWEMDFFVLEGTSKKPTRKIILNVFEKALGKDFLSASQQLAQGYGAKDDDENVRIFIRMADKSREKRENKIEDKRPRKK